MKWDTKRIWVTHLIFGVLVLTWLLPMTRPLWDWIDHISFWAFNSLAALGTGSLKFWAFLNYHKTDWFHDIIIAIFFVIYIAKGPSLRRFCEMIAAIVFTAIIIIGVNKTLIPKTIEISRTSPTGVYENTVRLKGTLNNLKIKDHSDQSFPSDHATLAIFFAYFAFYLMGRRAGFLALFYSLFMCLPRLIGGAHWLTDVIMGSLPITTLSLAWVLGSPLFEFTVTKLENGLCRLRLTTS